MIQVRTIDEIFLTRMMRSHFFPPIFAK